ncbi:DUF4926 domain-containing protein [Persicitalea sp.]|uniref:DUF4926 domain-containing protein n=1 Tax=Persicitalea sp. TaxID=3100273 RepID=UPI003593DAC1
MHRELDLVALLHDLPEHNLHRGDVGTVAHVYEPVSGDSGDFHVVEFMNAAGDTLAVVSLRGEEVKAVELQNVMLHVSNGIVSY